MRLSGKLRVSRISSRELPQSRWAALCDGLLGR